MNLEPSKVMVVENSQLGVESAYSAHMPFIVTLNNTSLNVQVNLDLLMRLDERECRGRIFADTKSAKGYLRDWCCT